MILDKKKKKIHSLIPKVLRHFYAVYQFGFYIKMLVFDLCTNKFKNLRIKILTGTTYRSGKVVVIEVDGTVLNYFL